MGAFGILYRRENLTMKALGDNIKRAAGLAAGAALIAGETAYLTTKVLMRTAFDREEPKLMQRAGNLISGTLVDEEILRRQSEAAEKLAALPSETVEITATDGVKLTGHWLACESPERVIIAMHGWRSSWCRDFGMIADFMRENHCAVLFAEQRGQNNSGGKYMGFGVTERYDCREWVRWVIRNRTETLPIYLCGISMGASSVLMAANLGLPVNVHGIIADCGFTSPDEICRHITRDNLHMSYSLRSYAAGRMFSRRNKAGSFKVSTEDALRETTTPVLLIHGTEDHFVPIEMTYRNYIACSSKKRLLVVPGADHGMSYLVDRNGYEAAVRSFWKEFDK